jgi:hypothetical protein
MLVILILLCEDTNRWVDPLIYLGNAVLMLVKYNVFIFITF